MEVAEVSKATVEEATAIANAQWRRYNEKRTEIISKLASIVDDLPIGAIIVYSFASESKVVGLDGKPMIDVQFLQLCHGVGIAPENVKVVKK